MKLDNIEGARFFKIISWDNKCHFGFEIAFSKFGNIGGQSYVSKICSEAFALDIFSNDGQQTGQH